MPELPEVENLRLGLKRVIVDQKILQVKVRKPKLVSGKGTIRKASNVKKLEFVHKLKGEKFLDVERRAKNLIFKLSHRKILLGHLKMSGQFIYQPKSKSKPVIGGHPIELSGHKLPNKHSHIIFELERGTLYYNDTRMFGYLLYYPNIQAFKAENHFKNYGVEPLSREFTLKHFQKELKKKTGKIKTVLLDQKIVTGLGNIYADESLFEARIRPNRNPSSLSSPEVKKLHTVIIRIMQKAIKVGGSSVATYRLLDMSQGNYAREHKVYGKAKKPCVNCGKLLSKTIIQGRTTIFCPKCQK